MNYCVPCRRQLNGAVSCPGCGSTDAPSAGARVIPAGVTTVDQKPAARSSESVHDDESAPGGGMLVVVGAAQPSDTAAAAGGRGRALLIGTIAAATASLAVGWVISVQSNEAARKSSDFPAPVMITAPTDSVRETSRGGSPTVRPRSASSATHSPSGTASAVPVGPSATASGKPRPSGPSASADALPPSVEQAVVGPEFLLSQDVPVSASSQEIGYSAGAGVDGDTTTRWASDWKDPQWLQVDLGRTTDITRVVLTWENYARSYKIQVSDNATTWRTLHSVTSGFGGVETLDVAGTGRYVRMYGTARPNTYGYSLWEFKVYGGRTATNS